MAINGSWDRRAYERRLFIVCSVLFPLIILIGFAQTYYLKGLFHSPPLRSSLVHLHGIVMSTWVALFIVQVRLVSARKIKTHQRLGFAAIGLALIILVVGFFTAVRAAKAGSAPPGPVSPIAFMIVPLTDLLMFTILFSAAIYFRKKPAEHKRLMLLTAVNFLPPAVARIPVTSLQALGPLWFFGFPAVLALLAVGIDWHRNKKLNKVFLAGTFLLISSFVIRLILMPTKTWLRIATWLTTWAA